MPKRIAWIDYLKIICIITVIVTHASWTPSERLTLLFPFTIDMAVPIFMIISGFNLAQSSKQKEIFELYSLHNLMKRYIRFTLPFVIAFIIEAVYLHHNAPFRHLIRIFYCGGEGPGSYYYPILIQFVLFAPLIFLIVRQNHKRGLLICGLINLFFEISVIAYGVNVETYRLLVFRYTFLIACGIYFYFEKDNIFKKKHYGWILLGFSYIFMTSYTDYQELIFRYWTSTSMMTAFWIFPIFLMLYRIFDKIPSSKIQIVGNASYHIFLTQMVYYTVAQDFVLKSLGISANYLAALVNVLICLAVGTLFYSLESKLESKVQKLCDLLVIKLFRVRL